MAKKRKKSTKKTKSSTASKKTTTKKKPQTKKKEEVVRIDEETQRGLVVLLLFGLAAIFFLSFIGEAGEVGSLVDNILAWMFGWLRYAVPAILLVLGYVLLHPEHYSPNRKNYIGLGVFIFAVAGLLHLAVPTDQLVESAKEGQGGGYVGVVLSYLLLRFTGVWVTVIVLVCMTLASWLVMFNMPLTKMLHMANFIHWFKRSAPEEGEEMEEEDYEDEEDDVEEEEPEEQPAKVFASKEIQKTRAAANAPIQPEQEKIDFVPKKRKRLKNIDMPVSLLTERNEKPAGGDIERNKEIIHSTFQSFGIDVEMGPVSVGPMVSQYTLKPSEGVKLTQITGLHNDIALALAAHPIRIEAPIPGKSLVGIEVPNHAKATVTLREMIESKEFKKRKDNLTMLLGKDVAGKTYAESITKMPHLLIAGATGSGKSVCINGLILSLLYQNTPNDLKLIMVDPKRVELTLYNDIPHLLTPVITDVEKTVNALKWTVAEMDRRYEQLARTGVRNLESYNERVDEDQKMPYIVFIIDELADLMAVAAQSVEAAIVRLAQMSRAVGIHLVLATQRPSVNVITGLIKANMPARCAFSVTSLVDSRTILDFSGAEMLLGKGDMLYVDATLSKPKRVQGAFVDDKDAENVVKYLREASDGPDYDHDVTETQRNVAGIPSSGGGADADSDEMIPEAKEVILAAGKASASMLQRRLRVGYARAARILDILEQEGFIGPAEGSKPREILVDPESEAAAMQAPAPVEDTGEEAEGGEVTVRQATPDEIPDHIMDASEDDDEDDDHAIPNWE